MAGGLLATLTAAIDELAGIDLDTVDDAELHDAVVGLGAVVDAVGGAVVPADPSLGQPSGMGRQRLQSRRSPLGPGNPPAPL